MRYLKNVSLKELKIRLKWDIFEAIKDLAAVENKSFNYKINELLGSILYKKEQKNFFIENLNLAYEQKGQKLYHNDFIYADLSEYIGKINLLVTSPPYNLSIEYGTHNDNTSYNEYLQFTKKWLQKSYELMADDGRICVNIPLDKNKNGLKSIYADFVKIAKEVGFNYQSTIIWNEQNISRRTAWGSWLSASAPYVIAPVEMIVVMYKKQWKRIKKGVSTISKDEFIKWTNGVWNFSGESKKRIGHPAPFPIELPKRCIKLFSYEDDIILDPFAGSATTILCAMQEKRKAIGIEIDKDYIRLAIERIKNNSLQTALF